MRLWDDAKALRRVTLWLYTLVVVTLCVAGFKWLWESPYFPIKNIHFYGDLKEVNQQQLASKAQQNISGNFFKADMNQLKQAMADNPWIEAVKVQRLWPDTVNVFITERQAKAHWQDGGLVDSKGQVFTAKTDKVLPNYAGPKQMMPKLVAFQDAVSPVLQQHQLDIKTLSVSERGAWTLELNNGVVLKLGRRDLNERLQRFLTYWQRDLQPLGQKLEYVDLRYHDGFAIKQSGLQDATNKEPSGPSQASEPDVDDELNTN